METYRFYPPQMQARQMPYQEVIAGAEDCRHELLEDGWCNRISIENGILFVTYSCRHCGRRIYQSLDEISPPASWNGASI